jgi:AraC-like DNA-binding protein
MAYVTNSADWEELCVQAPVSCPSGLLLEDFETLTGVSTEVGRGYSRSMELMPGLYVSFFNCAWHQDCVEQSPVEPDHPVQISILPTGIVACDQVHPTLGHGRSYFSGSGISPAFKALDQGGTETSCLNIEIQPELIHQVLLVGEHQWDDQLKQLIKPDDWKQAFYPQVTPEIATLVRQIWSPPYRGALKRIYLQAKVLELLVTYLDLVAGYSTPSAVVGLRADTMTRLYHAQQMLNQSLEHPPSVLELAQQVGLSDRTLLRGFKQLFGTTVVGYLTQQRLYRAEQLLRQGTYTVTEVARLSGYGHLGYFTAVFKRQFGITPKDCLIGQKSVL